MKLSNLCAKWLGRNNFYFDKIDSTQAEIWRMYEQGCESGTVVIAGIQEHGVGTHGRIWHTDEKNNIAFSLLIKPELKTSILDLNLKKLDGLTLEIAEIIVSIFKEKYNIELSIKEPNDIVYNSKKLGGILTETRVAHESVKAIVIGIGINTSKTSFSEDIKNTASSIKLEFDIDVNVQEFIEEFCNKFEIALNNRSLQNI